MFNEIVTIWSDQPGLSVAIWLALFIFSLYLARMPAHHLIRSIGRTLRAATRLSSRSISRVESNLLQRNKEVVLSLGRDAVEQTIEREFLRVNAIVSRNLQNYPALHRKIGDTIKKIDNDYHTASDAAPLPPAWLEAVESIASIPRNGDATVCSILDNIHQTVEQAHDETLKAWEKATLNRHKILNGMQPSWRTLSSTMEKVKDTIYGLDERSQLIDQQMEKYRAIRDAEDNAARLLTSSSLTQFFIAALVLGIAVFGGLINFQLIAMPMSEMVGGTSYIGAMKTSDIAALVIIMLEIAMGLFLMESLRITRLFPIIGRMDDKMRRRMMAISFAILATLATVEASLAYMRDLLALDREALTQSLAGIGVVEAEFRWIPSLGQMVMGFILPFTLAFVAIPLESFIHSVRTMLGLFAVAVLRTLSFSIRLAGGLANHLCQILIGIYDMVIVLPLGVERIIATARLKKDELTTSDNRTDFADDGLLEEKRP